jgi:hypothetical protein
MKIDEENEICEECGRIDHPAYMCWRSGHLYNTNLKGLENFKGLPIEKKLEFLEQIGILEKDRDKYKLSKDYGG